MTVREDSFPIAISNSGDKVISPLYLSAETRRFWVSMISQFDEIKG